MFIRVAAAFVEEKNTSVIFREIEIRGGRYFRARTSRKTVSALEYCGVLFTQMLRETAAAATFANISRSDLSERSLYCGASECENLHARIDVGPGADRRLERAAGCLDGEDRVGRRGTTRIDEF